MERKYKIGDKVRIVNERTGGMNSQGKMDKYLGTIMTIWGYRHERDYCMMEDHHEWNWNDNMIAGLVQDEVDPKTLKLYPGMVIHCKTQIEAIALLKCLSEKGYRWADSHELAKAVIAKWKHLYFKLCEGYLIEVVDEESVVRIIGEDKVVNFKDLSNTASAEKETKQEEAPLTAQEALESYLEIQKKCASGVFNCTNCPLTGTCRTETTENPNIPELVNCLSEYRKKEIPLAGLKTGERFRLADMEWIVLDIREDGYACLGSKIEHYDGTSLVFDPINDTNNWRKCHPSYVINCLCDALTERMGSIVSQERDLTSLDGLDDYGTIKEKVSMLTLDEYRKYRRLIPETDYPWFLITPASVKSAGDKKNYCAVLESGRVTTIELTSRAEFRPFCVFKPEMMVKKIR